MIYKKIDNENPNYWIEKQTIQLVEEKYQYFDAEECLKWLEENKFLYDEITAIELYLIQKKIKRNYCNFTIGLNATKENVDYLNKFLKKFEIKDVLTEGQKIDLNISFSGISSIKNDEEMKWILDLFSKYYNSIVVSQETLNELIDKFEEWIIKTYQRHSLLAGLTNAVDKILAIKEDAINNILNNNEVIIE